MKQRPSTTKTSKWIKKEQTTHHNGQAVENSLPMKRHRFSPWLEKITQIAATSPCGPNHQGLHALEPVLTGRDAAKRSLRPTPREQPHCPHLQRAGTSPHRSRTQRAAPTVRTPEMWSPPSAPRERPPPSTPRERPPLSTPRESSLSAPWKWPPLSTWESPHCPHLESGPHRPHSRAAPLSAPRERPHCPHLEKALTVCTLKCPHCPHLRVPPLSYT